MDNLTEPALKNATTTSIIEDNEKTGVLLRLFVPSYSSSSSLTAKKTKVKGTKESELSDGGDLLGPSALRKRRVATATTLARLKTRWLRQQRKSVEAEEQQQQQQKRRRRVKRQQATTAMATTTVAVIVGVTSFGSPV